MKAITTGLMVGWLAAAASAQTHQATVDAVIAQSAKGLNYYSLERERELGRRAAADLERALPIVHEPKLDAYMAQLGAALARETKSPFTYTFTAYEDRRPNAYITRPAGAGPAMPVDAFQGLAGEPVAVAGGPIFIPLSLLASAPDESVFAFQLAHAIAHIALRHATKQATRTEILGLEESRAQNMPIAFGAPTAVPMGMLSFSRAFERQADYVASLIVSQAGYSPESMAAYLSGQPAPAKHAAVFSMHPANRERSKAIQSQFESLPAAAYTAATGGFTEAKALAGRIR